MGGIVSAKLFELLGGSADILGHPAQLFEPGAVVRGGDHVFCGASELEEPVLERGDLGVGHDDGVFRKAAALHGDAALVGALSAGLAAVSPTAADVAALGKPSSAPSAMLGRCGLAHCGQLFAGHTDGLGHFAHADDTSCPSSASAGATPKGQTGGVETIHPYLAAPHPRAFAHRGWHLDDLDGMENSLSAFRRAVAEGYHYVETDVHATSDGVVVVHHDYRLDRTTDSGGVIARQTWEQVRRAKIRGREPVARLEDVLEELPRTHFNIDVKAGSAVLPFLRTIERTRSYERIAAASFSDGRLARMRRLAGPRLVTSMGPRSVAAVLARGRVPLLPLGFLTHGAMAQVPVRQGRLTIVDKAFLVAAERAGIEVHTWTIDDAEQMRELLDLGVHGIVTDRPDVLREVLIERGVWSAA